MVQDINLQSYATGLRRWGFRIPWGTEAGMLLLHCQGAGFHLDARMPRQLQERLSLGYDENRWYFRAEY